ncbi:MAG TPA: 5-(carboxyamino)imidazole ribonucleotide synthase [Chthonomonadaceae bacterium]|nr:5-(carboxyamino)imidazole ribonucleotide synthase [Chthonomonadaceae bacterium]
MIVGVLGGGQLGRMLALAGYPLGLRFRFLDPSPEAPAGHLAPCLTGNYDDQEALESFTSGLSVVTYEFENVPASSVGFLAERLPVYPPPEALEVAQDRLSEKTLFRKLGIPVPPFAPIDTPEDLQSALERIGLPAVLKTRRFGYDGKGQVVLHRPEDAAPALHALGGRNLILEGFVAFEREVSILAARGRSGATVFYPLVENQHAGGILRISLAPAPNLTPELQAQAQDYAARVLEALDYVGVLAIELFQREGQLLANEMAPRVHNSGHWTIEGAETSQFENHLRAVQGLPLGSTAARGHAAMLNLIGTTPEPAAVLAVPNAHLHLYGKSPRPGRKLGHVTLRADDPASLEAHLTELRRLIP